MNGNLKFSAVVAIYNIEKYVERCIDSLINQTYNNIEIILIDDGSNDMSSKICDYYKEKDDRINVIHKKNEGLGFARNTGLEFATGDYIAFFDGDDYVRKDLFEICYYKIMSFFPDIIDFDYYKVKNNLIYQSNRKRIVERYFCGDDVVNIYLKHAIYDCKNPYSINNCAWNKLFSIKVLRKYNFKFVSEKKYISEDYYSNLILFKNITSILLIKDKLYFYCYNEDSLTHILRDDRFEKNIFQYKESILLVNKLSYPNVFENLLAMQTVNNIFGDFKTIVLSCLISKKEKKQRIYKIIKSDEYYDLVIKTKNIKKRFVNSFYIYFIIHKMFFIAYIIICFKYKFLA